MSSEISSSLLLDISWKSLSRILSWKRIWSLVSLSFLSSLRIVSTSYSCIFVSLIKRRLLIYVLWVNSLEINFKLTVSRSFEGLKLLTWVLRRNYSYLCGIAFFGSSIWRSSRVYFLFFKIHFSEASYRGSAATISVLNYRVSISFWKLEALILLFLESFWLIRVWT